MPEVPHFALPFRFENGRAAEVEQDSVEDVAACVEAVLRTQPGEREELPGFGVPEATFSVAPLDVEAITAAVSAWEPRARVLATEAPDALDQAIRNVRLTVGTKDG